MSSEPAGRHPLLVVLSAPSGAGKTTLCDRLVSIRPDIVRSVSCTTRAPRGGEEHGKAYFFLSDEEFERRAAEGAFLEHATVHGFRYGTLRGTVDECMKRGLSVILAIDVQGAAQVRARVTGLPAADPLRRGFVDIFVEPPSMEVLRSRLTLRGEDAAEVVERRLRNAEGEMEQRCLFKYRLVNDSLDRAVAEALRILEHEARLAGSAAKV
jgi:guanylate kinase